MKKRCIMLFVVINLYSVSIAKDLRINLNIKDLILWLHDSSKINYFRYHLYKNRQESAGWTEPTNYLFKNSNNVTFYDQKILGISACFNDSDKYFYNIVLFIDPSQSKKIIDSINNDLYAVNKLDSITFGDSAKLKFDMLHWFSSNNSYIVGWSHTSSYYSYWMGTKYKYFDKSDDIYIGNPTRSGKDATYLLNNFIPVKPDDKYGKKQEKYHEIVVRKKLSKLNPEEYKDWIYKYKRVGYRLTKEYKRLHK